jgi:chromosome partitioning protein
VGAAFHKRMNETCSACGAAFVPAYVYQLAVTADRGRLLFCSLECRREGLGDEAFRARRARRLAILNHKGGTGKTTTAINLAAGIAERGMRVLLVDTDAQGNVGVSLGIHGERTLYHILVNGEDPSQAVVPVRKHLDVITSDPSLAAAEIWLARQDVEVRSRVLTRRLNLMQISRRYDYVVLDCGPSLNLLNQNALSYADEVIIPVTCDYLALVGVKQVLRTVREVERHLHHAVRVSAVLPTFYDARTRLACEVLAALRGHFKEKCLQPIRTNTRLAEAPSHRRTIFEHAPDSNGAEDYSRVVDWMLGTTSVQASDAAGAVAAEDAPEVSIDEADVISSEIAAGPDAPMPSAGAAA